MPEVRAAHAGDGKESGKTPAANGPTSPEAAEGKGETKPEKKAEEAERAQRGERAQRARELQEKLREAREFAKRTREQAITAGDKKISFADAASIAEIAEAVGKKTGAVIHPHEIARFKKILQEFGGYNAEVISKMDNMAIVVAAYEVLKTAPVDRAKVGDIKIADRAGRKEEEVRLGDLISGVKTSATELSKDEVEKYVTVEDEEFGYGEAEEGSLGAMAPAAWYDALPAIVATTSELGRFITRIRQIGQTGRDDLDRLRSIRGKLDEAVVTNALGGAGAAEINQVTEVLENRLVELRIAEREAIERSRETPPADDLLLITQYAKGLMGGLMRDDPATTADWAVRQTQLQELLARGQEIVDQVAPEGGAAPTMATGQVIETAIPGLANPYRTKTFRYVFEVTRALDEANKEYTAVADKAKLELIVGGADRLNSYIAKKRGERLISRLDRQFTKIYEDLTTSQQDSKVGDINEKAKHYFDAALSGWRDLDEATRIVLNLIDRKADNDGLREWKATKAFQSIIDAVKINQLTAVPYDWRDVPKVLTNIFNEIEDTQVSPDDLGAVAQNARRVIASIPADSEEGKQLRLKLSSRLEAFKAWHVMIMTLDKADMDPAPVIKGFQDYFEGREENTIEDFLERFGQDNRGRDFYITVDENGNALATPERINTFDVMYWLYNEKLPHDERIKMNIIEAMTRHAIDNQFDAATLQEIQIWAGLKNADGTISDFFGWNKQFRDYLYGGALDIAGVTAHFNNQVEALRIYFKEKMQQKINVTPDLAGMAVDDIWARKRNFTIEGLDISGINVTKDMISEWKQKRTLHGAFGTVQESDLVALADEFGIPYTVDLVTHQPATDTDEWRAIRGKFFGKSFQEVRRNALKELMIVQLRNQGLQVNRNIDDEENLDLRDADFEELNESGFFGSVEYNVYQWSWIKMWANLDNVRIYSRDSKSEAPLGVGGAMHLDDDFESVVYHNSTNLFWDRGITHTWEWYHEGVETRGRPKEADVNRIFKQFLPGKHHYVLPQNTAAVRWAENFMSVQQKAWVEARVKHLMRVYDFDNTTWHSEYVTWMKSVVIMDMIENGQFSFTQRDPTTGRYLKFSDVVKKKAIGKFEMIDLYSDRNKHKEWIGPTIFQSFLANPSLPKWKEIIDKTKNYYSTRDAREIPFNHFGLRALWEILNKHNRRLFDRLDMQSAAMETFVDSLAVEGDLDRDQAIDFKRKNLGFVKFAPHGNQDELTGEIPDTRAFLVGSSWARRVRQFGEIFRLSTWENKWSLGGILGVFFAMVGEYFKKLPGQLREHQ